MDSAYRHDANSGHVASPIRTTENLSEYRPTPIPPAV
jgi:hypothetical protein